MNNLQTKSELESIVISVFEQSAFVFLEPPGCQDDMTSLNQPENPDPYDDSERLGLLTQAQESLLLDTALAEITIQFEGEYNGVLAIVLPTALCVEINGNMLGEEICEAGETDACFDAVKEIMNIIGGHFVSQVYGEDIDIKLSIPEARQLSPEETISVSHKGLSIVLMNDDMPIYATLTSLDEKNEHTSTYS